MELEKIHTHTRNIGKETWTWDVFILWELSASLPIIQISPKSIDLEKNVWFEEIPNIREVLKHMKRIQDADLSYPVILGPDNALMDGTHRVCKAILENKETISAVRFEELPEPMEKHSMQ